MSVQTPNMLLIQSTVNVDSGINWELNLNSSLSIIDGHNHSPGSGVPVTPSGLNINADLSINGNNLTTIRSVRLSSQSSALAGSSDTNCIFVVNGNLYFTDGLGDSPIQITSGGAVLATNSGISSSPASAAFSSGVLLVYANAATTTPANVQVASVLLGNNTPASKYLTLSPPASMASNFGLTLPSIPFSTSVLTIDTGGNISAGLVTGSQIASSTITGSNISNTTIGLENMGARTLVYTGTGAVGNVSFSPSSGSIATSSTTWVDVPGVTLTLTSSASGRPIMVFLTQDGSSSSGISGSMDIGFGSGGYVGIRFVKDGSVIFQSLASTLLPFGSCMQMATQTASTTSTYKMQWICAGSSGANIDNIRLAAYEI